MNKFKTNYFFYIFITIFFIAISILLFLLTKGQSRNDNLYIQYIIEKTTVDLLESFREDNLPELLSNNKNILGFGIYNNKGIFIIKYGNVPDTIKIDLIENNSFKIDNFNNTVTLLRPIGMRFSQPPPPPPFKDNKENWMKNNHMKDVMQKKNTKYIYLQMDIKQYFGKNIDPVVRFIIFLIITLLVISLFIFLYRKSEIYKDKYKKHLELAHLGEASRTIAHEIKNPLAAIRIQTGYLKKVIPEDFKNEINVIEEEVDRIKNITDKIRDFLKEPLGNPERIEIDHFIKNIITKYDNLIIYNDLIKKTSYILIDPERLRSIIENVINNAIESSEEKRSIDIELKKDKNMIIISVLDRGIGLEKDYKEKIFDPFYTTKIQGSGIGLALTKRFIEAVNGKISIEPRDGGGTKTDLFFRIEENK